MRAGAHGRARAHKHKLSLSGTNTNTCTWSLSPPHNTVAPSLRAHTKTQHLKRNTKTSTVAHGKVATCEYLTNCNKETFQKSVVSAVKPDVYPLTNNAPQSSDRQMRPWTQSRLTASTPQFFHNGCSDNWLAAFHAAMQICAPAFSLKFAAYLLRGGGLLSKQCHARQFE